AYQDHNYSAALVSYWAVSERLVQELWQRYQDEHRTVDGHMVIPAKRRTILADSRTFTAAVLVEVLTFEGSLSFELYEKISAVRQVRNRWIHGLQATIHYQDAVK